MSRPATVSSLACAVLLFTAFAVPTAAQQTGTVTGTVRAANTQRPLSGAQVFLEGTRIGALANQQGRYLLLNVPVGAHVVRVEMLGYGQASQSIDVPAGGSVTADFDLAETAVALDEIVVTGTAAEVRAKEIANSLDAVTSRQIENIPAKSAEEILGGRVPGVTFMQGGGQAGAGGTIKIRGTNTVSGTYEPLIYVDGIRIYNLATYTGGGARTAVSPLQDINPKDIERVEVVKGAAATTLYGTEASAGVIQIFTKRGISGAPMWTAEVGLGLSKMPRLGADGDPWELYTKCGESNLYGLDVFNSDKTQRANRVSIADPTCPSDGDWQELGNEQRYSLSVRGGFGDVTYFVSGSYNDTKGTLPNQGSKDGGFRGNFDFSPLDNLTLTLNTAYTRRQSEFVPDGNNSNGFLLNVGRGPQNYLKGGKGEDCANITADKCVTNGYLFEDMENFTRNDHFISGFTVQYNPTDQLSNRFAVGYDYTDIDYRFVRAFGNLRSPEGFLDDATTNHTKVSIDYAGSFRNNFGDDIVSTFSWGGQVFRDKNRRTLLSVESFAGPGFPTIETGSTLTGRDDEQFSQTSAGFFFQEVLGWQDRFFLTGGLRVDGNSAFGDDYGLQYYPKVSGAWVVSDHDFWPTDWFETLKLRGAWGQSGKAPQPFAKLRTWTPVAGFVEPGFTPGDIGNQDVGPERTSEIEAGFDASIMQGRVGLEFTAFRATTTDALVGVTYPPSQGFLESRQENVGELKNEGIEIQLTTDLLRATSIHWQVRGNVSLLSSEAVDLAGQSIPADNKAVFMEGLPVPMYTGRKVMNPNEFADPEVESGQPLGNVFPTELVGLGTTITLGDNLTLDALAEYQGGHSLPNYTGYQNERRGAWYPCFEIQEKIIAANHLGQPNALDDVRAIDRAKCAINGSGVSANSDYWVESADFWKLRAVSLTYTLPQNLVSFANSATVTLSGRNLFTWTDYNGADPEVEDFGDRAGLFYDGSEDYGRRDYYTIPTSRTFLLSFRVSF